MHSLKRPAFNFSESYIHDKRRSHIHFSTVHIHYILHIPGHWGHNAAMMDQISLSVLLKASQQVLYCTTVTDILCTWQINLDPMLAACWSRDVTPDLQLSNPEP